MPLPGRQLTPGSYRYGFNGKELDANGTGMGGGGNTYDYGFRIYNPQIAKFLSVDPLSSDFPFLTPYQFASNMPIAAIDIDGLEAVIVVTAEYWNKKITKAVSDGDINRAITLAVLASTIRLTSIPFTAWKYATGKGGWVNGAPATYNFSEKNPQGVTIVFKNDNGVEQFIHFNQNNMLKGKAVEAQPGLLSLGPIGEMAEFALGGIVSRMSGVSEGLTNFMNESVDLPNIEGGGYTLTVSSGYAGMQGPTRMGESSGSINVDLLSAVLGAAVGGEGAYNGKNVTGFTPANWASKAGNIADKFSNYLTGYEAAYKASEASGLHDWLGLNDPKLIGFKCDGPACRGDTIKTDNLNDTTNHPGPITPVYEKK
jgi:RHS repeat-associated protein